MRDVDGKAMIVPLEKYNINVEGKVDSPNPSVTSSAEEDMEESLISKREQSRHTDSKSADFKGDAGLEIGGSSCWWAPDPFGTQELHTKIMKSININFYPHSF